MTADDVTATLKLALEASGCNRAHVVHKPRLLSDNGSSYISGDLAEWLEDHGMDHVRGAPYHPQTQGKIERWHQTLKNRILLENYYLPGDLENQIGTFVDHYNSQRYHESIGNATPADAYFGRHTAIVEKRKKIKKRTTQNRRLNHQSQVSDVSAFGTNGGNCITEDFWLIVVTEGNEDETEINAQERPGGENGSGYSPQDTQAVYG